MLVTLTATVANAEALPEQLATGWTSDGVATAAGSRTWELLLGVVVVALGAGFVAAADQVPGVLAQRGTVALGHAAAIGWAAQRLRTITANLHVDHWSQATPSVSLLAVASAVAAGALVGWLISRHRHRDPAA